MLSTAHQGALVLFHSALNICHYWSLHHGSLLVVNVKWYLFGVCFLEQRVFWVADEPLVAFSCKWVNIHSVICTGPKENSIYEFS